MCGDGILRKIEIRGMSQYRSIYCDIPITDLEISHPPEELCPSAVNIIMIILPNHESCWKLELNVTTMEKLEWMTVTVIVASVRGAVKGSTSVYIPFKKCEYTDKLKR